jgi:hypothetical protein
MKLIASAALVILLTACGGGGGGGGSSSAPTTSGTAEGLWVGTASTGYGVAALILENAETWGFYFSGSTTAGVLNGASTGSGSVFSAAGTEFNFNTRTASSSTLSGTVVPGVSINASSTLGGTVNLNYEPSYNTPASLAAVAGSYSGWGQTVATASQRVNFVVSSSGAITAAQSGCSVSGTITPRSSGKNVYNVSTTFTGSACAIGNGVTTTGVATLVNSGGLNRLIVMTLNQAKTDGYIVNGFTSGTPGVAATVPAQAAVINWVKAANTQLFNLYATNGCLGVLTSAKTNATSQEALFEGAVRPYSTTTTTLRYSNCTPTTTTGVEQLFTSSSYIPFGFSIISGVPVNDGYYGLYAGTPNFPISLTAGQSGSVGTINKYTNSTKTVSAGRNVVTYTSAAETSTSLLLDIVYEVYNASNQLSYTEKNTFRVTTSGIATLLGGEITYPNGLVVNFR